jgi:purine nucleoside phosphorylase
MRCGREIAVREDARMRGVSVIISGPSVSLPLTQRINKECASRLVGTSTAPHVVAGVGQGTLAPEKGLDVAHIELDKAR